MKAKDEAKDDDRSEIDLVEFSQKLSISACASSDADEDDEVVVLGTNGPVRFPILFHSLSIEELVLFWN